MPESESFQDKSKNQIKEENREDIIRELQLHNENVLSTYSNTVSSIISLYNSLEKRIGKLEDKIEENNKLILQLMRKDYTGFESKSKVISSSSNGGIESSTIEKIKKYISSSDKHYTLLHQLVNKECCTRETLKEATGYSDLNQISSEISNINKIDQNIIMKQGRKFYINGPYKKIILEALNKTKIFE